MRKMSAVEEMVLWMILIAMMLLAFVLILDLCNIPVYVKHYEGFSRMSYLRLEWVEQLRRFIS